MNDIVINPPRRPAPVIVEADAPAQVTTEIGRGRPGEPGPPGASDWAGITGKPTTLAGYGITDAATAAQGVLAGTALQPASIGVTVQGYSAALAGTTASFTTADEAKLDDIEVGADVTDAASVNAAGAVMNSDYSPAHSILVQQSGTGSPTVLQVANNTLLGRLSGGGSNIGALTASEVRTLINVADGAQVNAPAQVYVQDTDPGMTGPGIWIQTGLAPGGTGFTFWFEDGL